MRETACETHLSRLLHRVEAGEEVVISRAGVPVAKLTPLAKSLARLPGRLKDKINIGPDFDDPLPDDLWASEP